MAIYPSLLLLFIVFVAITSQAHGFTINGTLIEELRVNGRLVCSVPHLLRNPANSVLRADPISTAVIEVVGELLVNLYAVNLVVGRVVTDTDGIFQIDVPNSVLSTLPFDAERFSVRVLLPVLGCPIFGNTGTIQTPIRFLSILNDSGRIVALFGTPA